MINPLNKTEYSFRYAYGKIKDIVESSTDDSIVMADRFTTFGHIPFYALCKKKGIKPILGVEIAFVDDALLKVRQNASFVTLLAINMKGLSKIYQLVTKSSKQKYYYNRLSKKDLRKINQDDIAIVYKEKLVEDYLINRKNTYLAVTPTTSYKEIMDSKHPLIAASDNIYHKPEDEESYQFIMGNGQWESRTTPCHVMDELSWRYELNHLPEVKKTEAIFNTTLLARTVEIFDFPQASLPKTTEKRSLLELCMEGAVARGCDLTNPVYKARLDRELELIHEKKYDEYFYLTRDLVDWAKQHMLVGPARGSSAGSLVCYLLFITEIDPIPFGLIFERFIDLNRMDLPDIDIDFQDTKRDKIIDYLKEKYGEDCVAKLGTVSKYKPNSILNEVAKCLKIPAWEIDDIKNSIPERKPGDERASKCIEDSFTDLEIGKEFIEKHPEAIYSQEIEGHNRHFGQHPAGIVVADSPINNYCSIDSVTGSAMLDKEDAETVNLLKMDCLGLRTLSVIQDCLDLIKKDRKWLVAYPLDDKKAFAVINDKKFSGIFQFEGDALIGIAKQISIQDFETVAAITALGRPGPMKSGGTVKYTSYKNDPSSVVYLPQCEKYTEETFGIIVYQEQVMHIVKNVGNLSWEDTCSIRKAMGKTLGEEIFDKYKKKFVDGAKRVHNLSEDDSLEIWNNIITHGAYSFNKSHSVSYGLISYWCMVLKAHWPLEFALATLKNAKSEEQTIGILKELVKENYEYETFNQKTSLVDWSIQDGKLVGGFINIKGIGIKKAQTLIKKRKDGVALTVSEKRMLFNADTPYDKIFEFRENFQGFYDNWELFFKDKPILIEDIEEGEEVRFLCKTISHKLRDVNEESQIKKRDGKVITDGCLSFLDIKMADDTETVRGRIGKDLFEKFGRSIATKDKEGSYYLVKGFCCKDFKYIIVQNIKKVTQEEILEKIKRSKE